MAHMVLDKLCSGKNNLVNRADIITLVKFVLELVSSYCIKVIGSLKEYVMTLMALLGKWKWRVLVEEDALRNKILVSTYGKWEISGEDPVQKNITGKSEYAGGAKIEGLRSGSPFGGPLKILTAQSPVTSEGASGGV
ncbi:unnamed protein product [Sphenostylis stenocarpa]|uniref:Uncharacterized protein n=1 Tax=Sphenostylis stenocarpa TaxID=92480 RepID=A0AA86RR79_9FABA|nr:unnamed protein product [Sphenostylis stenocarpa]